MRRRCISAFVCLGLGLGLPASNPSQGASKQNFGLITGSTTPAGPKRDEQHYCENFADEAREAQLAWRLARINELEAGLAKRIDELERSKAALETWMARRQAFLDRARENLVDIYTRMRPDAAAQQIAALDDLTAAALLIKLDSRAASLILAEIDANRAAQLTKVIVGSQRTASSGGGT